MESSLGRERRRVLILDGSCDPRSLEARDLAACTDLVALCWLRPSTLERLRQLGGLRCHGLLELVGGLERRERRAIARMERVCGAGPRYRDLPWRSLLAEPDRFASGIPMVIPTWPELGWRDRLEKVRGVHLAADFDDLAETLEAWIREPPRMDREESRPFLRPAGEGLDELRRWLADLAGDAET